MRKTIAVLVDYIDHMSRGYEFELREAFEAACLGLDVNLLLVAGRPLDDTDPWTLAQNSVFDMIGPRLVDGIIVGAAGLAAQAGIGAVERLIHQYADIPICSLGLAIPGIPSVVVDSRSGMERLVDHMVRDHACSQFVFLGGPQHNPNAALRLEVFREVMDRHGKALDPKLVRFTDFTYSMGKQAIDDLLLDGANFDAVIAASDALGVGACESLRAHNVRIPLNVRVTGFDDLPMSRLSDPPLSTVRQPLREMAARAVDVLMAQIAGQAVLPCTTLTSEFLPRESCGCGSQAAQISLPPRAVSPRSIDFVHANSHRILRRLRSTLPGFDKEPYAAGIFAALEAELNGERFAFVAGLENLLIDARNNGEIFEDFQRVVTLLRSELRSVQDPELEELWHEARTQIALVATRAHFRQTSILEDRYDRLLKTGGRFATSLGLSSLKAVLLQELPVVHVRSAVVSLTAGPEKRLLEPFFCLRNGLPFAPSDKAFPADQLFPQGVLSNTHRETWLVFPLTFEAEFLGVVAFEHAASVVGYEMFRDRISAALKTAAMHEEIVRQAASEERNNQERLAAAERIKSLSVLAGGVAHDLNNALAPLSALPDVILQELKELNPQGFFDSSEVAIDLTTIKSAALRAAQTIKDLLTLGRQRQVNKELVDLTPIAAGCVADIGAIQANDGSKQPLRKVEVESTFASGPLCVRGSETHLTRAIANLLRNAVEASDSFEPIRICTFALHLSEPLSGYEIVEPGDYAVVSVSDFGPGIVREDIHRIFEPFVSNKKLCDTSGSGLGLAIVHGVVKEHGGFINVESTLGSGTTFTLYFPLLKQAPRTSQPKLPARARAHGKILVVDDDPMQLRTARRTLTRSGYEVVTADTGMRAYELFGMTHDGDWAPDALECRSPFDLVILDMMLNGSDDGLAIFENIRTRYPAQAGILVSGHAPMERGQLALDRGMAWLSKPYTVEALLQLVQHTLLSSSDWMSAWVTSGVEQDGIAK